MKYVIDPKIATAWYVNNSTTMKAMRVRFDFIRGVHELLAPDTLPAECAQILVEAEMTGAISTGRTLNELNDLRFLGIPLHASYPLLARAVAIALTTRLKISASLYVALAEREQCQLLTADPKLLRNARRHFTFVVPLASIP